MKITIDDTSSMFGLTTESLKLSGVQALLRRRGIVVTYPDSKHAIIESANGAFWDASFQQEIEEIKKKSAPNLEKKSIAEERPTESNEYSWFVLNEFLIVLGISAVATALIALSGASWITIVPVGIGLGIGALLKWGLFQCAPEAEQDSPSQLMPSVT